VREAVPTDHDRNQTCNLRDGAGEKALDGVEAGIERLEALGLRFPKTRLAAKETVQKILETQRTILRVRSGPLSVSSFSAAKPY